jgi:hypothetical protein
MDLLELSPADAAAAAPAAPSETASTAELAECICPEFCERDHANE